MRLVGPYAGPCDLALGDRISSRTGLSVNRFDYGVCEERGARRAMEDRTRVVQDLAVPGLEDLAPQTFYGVFDGHGGDEAAAFLRDELAGRVGAALAGLPAGDRQAQLAAALRRAFLDADDAFLRTSANARAGSTCVAVLVLGDVVVCANVGDSRALLCRGGRAVALSRDHTPARDDEAARIRAAGGFVIHRRVMGELAVSRAFGDAELKKSVAEIFDAVGESDEFLLLACDGLFDVFSDAEAVAFVRGELADHGDPQRAAERVTNAAIVDRGTRDNVSVIVVKLK
ncbi:protein serine/threonine phosphatase [Aureococcus anophagefferens]|nr:protein serine/threonine phosphatase [Aureococcus anophagefferens]